MIKLSIIIPVYNVEKYILACLDSVVCQSNASYDDYEVIVVNDGSPDRSIEIINKYEWRGCHHQVINQVNRGLSGARNTGLDYANGEYVWFVDSDDVISKDAVSKIICNANNSDIINISHCRVIDGVIQKSHLPGDSTSGIEMLRKGYSHEAPFHIFKMELLDNNKLRFYEGIYHEDTEFTPRCLYLAEKVVNIQSVLYYYQIRGGSIMSVIKPKRAFDNLIVAKSLINFSIEHGEDLSSTPILNTICLSLNNALYVISQANMEEQIRWNREFCNQPLFFKALRKSSIIKYKIEGYIFSIFPFSKVQLYNLISKLKRK